MPHYQRQTREEQGATVIHRYGNEGHRVCPVLDGLTSSAPDRPELYSKQLIYNSCFPRPVGVTEEQCILVHLLRAKSFCDDPRCDWGGVRRPQ
jgi:hypothetical protein